MDEKEEKKSEYIITNFDSTNSNTIFVLIDSIRSKFDSMISDSKLKEIDNLLSKLLMLIELQKVDSKTNDLIYFCILLLRNCSNNFSEEITTDERCFSTFLHVVKKVFVLFNSVNTYVDVYLDNMDFIVYFLDYLSKDIDFSCKLELYNFFSTLCFKDKEFCSRVFDSHIFAFLNDHYQVKEVYPPFSSDSKFVCGCLDVAHVEKVEGLIFSNIDNVDFECAFSMISVILNISNSYQRVYSSELYNNTIFYTDDIMFIEAKYGCMFLDYVLIFDPIPNVINDVLKLYQRFSYIDLIKDKIMNYILRVKEYTDLFENNQVIYQILSCNDFLMKDKLFIAKLSSQLIKFGIKELDMLYIKILIELEEDTFIFDQLLRVYHEFKRSSKLTEEFTSIFSSSEKLNSYIQQDYVS